MYRVILHLSECQDPDYRCDDGVTCVFEDEICDGIPQCPSGEDEEMDCPTSAPPAPGKKNTNFCYIKLEK